MQDQALRAAKWRRSYAHFNRSPLTMILTAENWTDAGIRAHIRTVVIPELQALGLPVDSPVIRVRIAGKSAIYRLGEGDDGLTLKIPSAKQPKHQTTRHEYVRLRILASDRRTLPMIPVIEPVGFLKRSQVLVTRWHPHPTLQSLLSAARPEAEAGVTAAARWLARFHNRAVPTQGLCKLEPTERTRQNVDAGLQALPLPIARRLVALLPAIELLRARLHNLPMQDMLIHGDAAPANFLFDGIQVTTLDLASVNRQSDLRDFSVLLVNVVCDAVMAQPGATGLAGVDRMTEAIADIGRLNTTANRSDLARYMVLLNGIYLIKLRYRRPALRALTGFGQAMDHAIRFLDRTARGAATRDRIGRAS